VSECWPYRPFEKGPKKKAFEREDNYDSKAAHLWKLDKNVVQFQKNYTWAPMASAPQLPRAISVGPNACGKKSGGLYIWEFIYLGVYPNTGTRNLSYGPTLMARDSFGAVRLAAARPAAVASKR